MSRDDRLRRRLRDLQAPDERGAEERAWEIVREAHRRREPVSRRRRRWRAPLALAGAVLVLAVGLSPAGARVADLVTDVIGVGAGDARPELARLPAAGELLVESPGGAWIVREDGSKRRLGDYKEVDWSPNARFVAASQGRRLAAIDPVGEVRWTITAPRRISDPRWSGTDVDTRIAYRSGDDLRVVAGNGTGDALLAGSVSPVAPAWLPVPESKLLPAPEASIHVLAYASGRSRIALVDTEKREVVRRIVTPGGDSIAAIDFAPDGSLMLVRTHRSLLAFDPRSGRLSWRIGASTSAAAFSPDGTRIAAVTEPDRPNAESRLLLIDAQRGDERRLPAGLGRFGDLAFSPDGRWLLLSWQAADQWLFVRLEPDRPRRVIAVGGISSQFDPGSGAEAFPGLGGWLLPDRP